MNDQTQDTHTHSNPYSLNNNRMDIFNCILRLTGDTNVVEIVLPEEKIEQNSMKVIILLLCWSVLLVYDLNYKQKFCSMCEYYMAVQFDVPIFRCWWYKDDLFGLERIISRNGSFNKKMKLLPVLAAMEPTNLVWLTWFLFCI